MQPVQQHKPLNEPQPWSAQAQAIALPNRHQLSAYCTCNQPHTCAGGGRPPVDLVSVLVIIAFVAPRFQRDLTRSLGPLLAPPSLPLPGGSASVCCDCPSCAPTEVSSSHSRSC